MHAKSKTQPLKSDLHDHGCLVNCKRVTINEPFRVYRSLMNNSSAIKRLPQVSFSCLTVKSFPKTVNSVQTLPHAGSGGFIWVQALLVAHERLMAAQHAQRMLPIPARLTVVFKTCLKSSKKKLEFSLVGWCGVL